MNTKSLMNPSCSWWENQNINCVGWSQNETFQNTTILSGMDSSNTSAVTHTLVAAQMGPERNGSPSSMCYHHLCIKFRRFIDGNTHIYMFRELGSVLTHSSPASQSVSYGRSVFSFGWDVWKFLPKMTQFHHRKNCFWDHSIAKFVLCLISFENWVTTWEEAISTSVHHHDLPPPYLWYSVPLLSSVLIHSFVWKFTGRKVYTSMRLIGSKYPTKASEHAENIAHSLGSDHLVKVNPYILDLW